MSKVYKNMSIFMMLYVVIQPILDVITGTMIHQVGASREITVGIVVRMIVMIMAFIYIILSRKNISKRKYLILMIYIVISAVILLINLWVSSKYKPVFSLKAEIGATAKALYFVVMLGAYWIAFKDLFNRKITAKYFPRVAFYAILIVDIIMITAHFTHSSFNAYAQMKLGESGWFFAANEIGAILAITLPIVLMFVINQTKTWKQWYYWIGLFATIYSCLLLGTKSGLLSVASTLLVAAIIALFKIIKAKGKDKKSIVIFLVLCFSLVGLKVILPTVTASQNIKVQETYIKQQRQKVKHVDKIQKKKKLDKSDKKYLSGISDGQKKIIQNNEINSTLKSLIFSSRTVYLNTLHEYYNKAPKAQKLFGMGLGGNYQYYPKTSEMDFFDLFYEFGILGFAMIVLPLTFAMLYIISNALKNWRSIFTYRIGLVLFSTAMAIVISFIAGHVMTAPAVSIYLAAMVSYLIVEYQNKKTSD